MIDVPLSPTVNALLVGSGVSRYLLQSIPCVPRRPSRVPRGTFLFGSQKQARDVAWSIDIATDLTPRPSPSGIFDLLPSAALGDVPPTGEGGVCAPFL